MSLYTEALLGGFIHQYRFKNLFSLTAEVVVAEVQWQLKVENGATLSPMNFSGYAGYVSI